MLLLRNTDASRNRRIADPKQQIRNKQTQAKCLYTQGNETKIFSSSGRQPGKRVLINVSFVLRASYGLGSLTNLSKITIWVASAVDLVQKRCKRP